MERKLIATPVRDHLVKLRNGAIQVCCFDGAHFHEWYGFVAGIATRQHGGIPNVCPLSLPGGPLVVDPTSPINRVADHTPAVNFAFDTAMEIGYRYAVFHGHAGCRAAHKHKISLFTNVDLIVRAKQYFKAKYKGTEGLCLLHLKHPERGDLHFHLSAKSWLENRDQLRF